MGSGNGQSSEESGFEEGLLRPCDPVWAVAPLLSLPMALGLREQGAGWGGLGKVMGKPQEGWNSICNVLGVMQTTQMVIFTLF